MNELFTYFNKWVVSNSKFPMLVIGKPGVSKTHKFSRLGRKAGLNVIGSIPATQTPEAIQGIAVPDRNLATANFLQFGNVRRVFAAKEPTLWIVDDFIQSPQIIKNGYMAVMWDRELNGLRLPDCVKILILTNSAEDSCGAMGEIPGTVRTRCRIFHHEPDYEEFLAYVQSQAWNAEISAYLRYQPDSYYQYNPDQVQSVTFRGWEMVQEDLTLYPADERAKIPPMVFQSSLGEGVGISFSAFVGIFQSLASFEEILRNPEKAKSLSLQHKYALSGVLENACFSKPEVFEKVWDVIPYLGSEMAAAFAFSLIRREDAENKKAIKEGRPKYKFSEKPELIQFAKEALEAL